MLFRGKASDETPAPERVRSLHVFGNSLKLDNGRVADLRDAGNDRKRDKARDDAILDGSRTTGSIQECSQVPEHRFPCFHYCSGGYNRHAKDTLRDRVNHSSV